jgi:hypothetical protein
MFLSFFFPFATTDLLLYGEGDGGQFYIARERERERKSIHCFPALYTYEHEIPLVSIFSSPCLFFLLLVSCRLVHFI